MIARFYRERKKFHFFISNYSSKVTSVLLKIQVVKMLIPIVIGAIALGKAFDMRIMSPTANYIYDPNSIATNLEKIPQTFTSAHYRLLESSSDVNDFLDISGELILKAKLGEVKIRGYGNYVLPKINREKTVEILITVNHQTVTETFPTYTDQREEYKTHNPKDVGTHYIRSIVYGGQLIISYKLIAKKSEYMEDIKAAVSANLRSEGKVDAGVKGQLDKLSKEIEGKCLVSIQAFATAGAINPPTNLDQVLQLVEEYPSLVAKLNDGKGSPLKLELMPISSVNPNYAKYSKNMALDRIVNDATNKFDDLRVATSEFKAWESTQLWNDEQQKLINAYNRKLGLARKAMIKAISELDLSQNNADDHFEKAFNEYGKDGENIPNRYMRELTLLIHTVENIPFYWFPYTKSITHYVHWGSINCTSPSPVPIQVGYAATSPKGFGSGASLQCLNADPALEEKKLSDSTKVSYLAGLTYQTPSGAEGNVYCAVCQLTNATTVTTIPGRADCPGEMKLEYTGYLATNSKAVSKYVCMDNNPDNDIADLPVSGDKHAGQIVPVWMKCESCDEDEQTKYVSCAVCSR